MTGTQPHGFGRPIRRIEDLALLTGGACFAADMARPGMLHGVFLRSPHAHAHIVALDVAAARAVPGVHAVLTGTDLQAAGIGALPFVAPLRQADGAPMSVPPRHALATGVVRHVGEAVALVIAGTAAAAQDGAEAISVEYRALPAVTDPLAPDQPELWPGLVERNILGRFSAGDMAAARAAVAAAPHSVSVRVCNQRLAPSPLEPRAALAEPEHGRIMLHTATQAPHILREQLARTLALPPEAVRVRTGDIGGGFGQRMFLAPEHVAIAAAARLLDAPVRWVGTRSDGLVSDTHGRDQVSDATLAFDGDGRFLALAVQTLANAGATLSNYGAVVPTRAGTRILTGCYAIPVAAVEVRVALTNTVPVDAYRGAGRPETLMVVERLADLAARALGLDPVTIRRRNLVPPSAMPYRTALGEVYDSGDFPRLLDRALEAADWSGFPARRDAARAAGRRLGRGLACYIESTGMANLAESIGLHADADGVTLRIGTQGMGQGLATSYVQLLSHALGLAPDYVRVVMGDTDAVPRSVGSGGSRSLYVGGTAVADGAAALIEAARPLAAAALEAADADVTFANGRFVIVGTDRGIGLRALAALQQDGAIRVLHRSEVEAISWPNGVHVAEVDIDQATGATTLLRMTAVDDAGRVVHAPIVHGQVQGGLAQGVGQALLEAVRYGPDGQPLSGSLMDYALPRADDLPAFSVHLDEGEPCRANPLGAKGAGEAGAIGAPPAVVAAVLDALGPAGPAHLDMPLTAETVWRASRPRAGPT